MQWREYVDVSWLMAGNAPAMPARQTLDAQAWRRDAACAGTGLAGFFGGSSTEARAMCPVQADCLEYALAQGAELDGLWAGTTPRDRARLRRIERQKAA